MPPSYLSFITGMAVDELTQGAKDPDKVVEVEFVADRKGTFDFRCVVLCGTGHPKMKGKLIVE